MAREKTGCLPPDLPPKELRAEMRRILEFNNVFVALGDIKAILDAGDDYLVVTPWFKVFVDKETCDVYVSLS